MKKLTLIALALALATSAQALPTSWKWDVNEKTHSLGDAALTLSAGCDFSLTLAFQSTSTSLHTLISETPISGTNTRFFSLNGSGLPSPSMDLVKPGGSAWHLDFGVSGGPWTSSGGMPTGTIREITLTFSGSVDEEGKCGTITFEIAYNGNGLGAKTQDWSDKDGVGSWDSLTVLGARGEPIDGLTITVESEVSPWATIPEPTALALLALGVSALAFRRRTA